MVSASILFMHFKGLKSKHFGLIKKWKTITVHFPPSPNSVLLPEVWLCLCTEDLCTQTQTPWAHLGSWPKHRCHAGNSKALRPRQWAQLNSTGVLITELRAQENWHKCLILRQFSPSRWVQPDAGKAWVVSLGWLKGVPLNSGCLRKDCCWRRGEERVWGCKHCPHQRWTGLSNPADTRPIQGPPLLSFHLSGDPWSSQGNDPGEFAISAINTSVLWGKEDAGFLVFFAF